MPSEEQCLDLRVADYFLYDTNLSLLPTHSGIQSIHTLIILFVSLRGVPNGAVKVFLLPCRFEIANQVQPF